MKYTLTVFPVAFLIGILVAGCGYFEVKSDSKAIKQPSVSSSMAINPGTTNAKPISDNSADLPSTNAGNVTVNPHSPYPDYCEIVAMYLNLKFDTSMFKHITIEDLQMYAKQTNPKYEFGEVTLNVEHVKGKVSKYREGKNKLFIRFAIHPDGSKNLDSIDFSPFTEVKKSN